MINTELVILRDNSPQRFVSHIGSLADVPQLNSKLMFAHIDEEGSKVKIEELVLKDVIHFAEFDTVSDDVIMSPSKVRLVYESIFKKPTLFHRLNQLVKR